MTRCPCLLYDEVSMLDRELLKKVTAMTNQKDGQPH
jgi:hypothetical protein